MVSSLPPNTCAARSLTCLCLIFLMRISIYLTALVVGLNESPSMKPLKQCLWWALDKHLSNKQIRTEQKQLASWCDSPSALALRLLNPKTKPNPTETVKKKTNSQTCPRTPEDNQHHPVLPDPRSSLKRPSEIITQHSCCIFNHWAPQTNGALEAKGVCFGF